MTVTDAEYRELRYRVEQQGRRIQQLEQTKHFVSANGSFTVFDSTGGVAVRMGKLTDPDDHDIEVRTSTGGYVRLEDLISPQAAETTAAVASSAFTYGDLSGSAGPAVTVNIGPTRRAVVTVGLDLSLATTSAGTISQGFMSYAVSGASTIAADDGRAASGLIANVPDLLWEGTVSRTIIHTGLSSGSNTFTAKYRTNGSTGVTFDDRTIVVQPY